MIEVKDEILNGEPKYRLRNENGDIIYDNVSVEMTTPVVEEGTPLNKALFDSIGNDLLTRIPKGLICMWSGTTIPTGWFLCDGTNGTPDLRDRFIVGSGSAYNIGGIGGSDSVTLTIDQMPTHNHTLEWWASAGNYQSSKNHLYCKDSQGHSGTLQNNISKASAASTSLITANVNNKGGGQPFDNRPPYYALAFIMKA